VINGSIYILARVNCCFNGLAVPFLYEWIDIDEGDVQTMPLVFRTLLEVARLACLLKHVEWTSDAKQIVLVDTAQATGLIRALPIPNYCSRVISLEGGCRDILLSLLLCMTPSIEEFSVYVNDEIALDSIPAYIQPLLYAARGTPFDTAHSFEHLSYLSIRYCSIRPSKFSALFNLPALASLELYAGEIGEDEAMAARTAWPKESLSWECPAHTSSLKHLAIAGTPCSMAISTMITSCSSLPHFHFSGDAWTCIDPNWFHVVEKACQTQIKSLQRISFNNIDFGYWIPPTHTIMG
jgi:hypothetical protein